MTTSCTTASPQSQSRPKRPPQTRGSWSKREETLEGLQSKDGAVQGMTASVKQTMDDARGSMGLR